MSGIIHVFGNYEEDKGYNVYFGKIGKLNDYSKCSPQK